MYVGSADSTDYDQVLNEVLVGPVPVGMNRFVLEVGVRDAHAVQPCGKVTFKIVLHVRCCEFITFKLTLLDRAAFYPLHGSASFLPWSILAAWRDGVTLTRCPSPRSRFCSHAAA